MGTRQRTMEPSPEREWPQDRVARVLDRIDHRQEGVGLRFWGPPLWLEVTMTGPDSDGWPANPSGEESWDWQSTDTCVEAEHLLQRGGDDEELLLVVGRYTVENLILNAVHEIGEWLRLDGHRLYPAHPAHPSGPGSGDGQGNGAVTVEVGFAPRGGGAPPIAPREDELAALRMLRVVQRTVDGGRFTYLPGTSIQFRASGPAVLDHRGGSASEWLGHWSPATRDAVRSDGHAETVLSAVGADVHRALVASEADRVCRAFHIDGRRPWTFAGADPAAGPDGGPDAGPDGDPAAGPDGGPDAGPDGGPAAMPDEAVVVRIRYQEVAR